MLTALEKIKTNRMFGKRIKLHSGKKGICNIVGIITNETTKKNRLIFGANIVTNDGDQYYAQEGAGEATAFTVAGNRLGTAITPASSKTSTDVTTFLAGSGKAIDATYPRTNDGDADNTGSGIDVVTWRISYATTEGNGNGITEGALVDNITTPTKALTHYEFAASFNKTPSDTLKIFGNHQMNGV